MKIRFYLISLIIILITIYKTNTFSLDNIFNLQGIGEEEDENNQEDSEEVMLKLRNFFDIYAKSMKNKIKKVNKIILPSSKDNASDDVSKK
jgi:hypothetical protein